MAGGLPSAMLTVCMPCDQTTYDSNGRASCIAARAARMPRADLRRARGQSHHCEATFPVPVLTAHRGAGCNHVSVAERRQVVARVLQKGWRCIHRLRSRRQLHVFSSHCRFEMSGSHGSGARGASSMGKEGSNRPSTSNLMDAIVAARLA